jgi:hypothetical protein
MLGAGTSVVSVSLTDRLVNLLLSVPIAFFAFRALSRPGKAVRNLFLRLFLYLCSVCFSPARLNSCSCSCLRAHPHWRTLLPRRSARLLELLCGQLLGRPFYKFSRWCHRLGRFEPAQCRVQVSGLCDSDAIFFTAGGGKRVAWKRLDLSWRSGNESPRFAPGAFLLRLFRELFPIRL